MLNSAHSLSDVPEESSPSSLTPAPSIMERPSSPKSPYMNPAAVASTSTFSAPPPAPPPQRERERNSSRKPSSVRKVSSRPDLNSSSSPTTTKPDARSLKPSASGLPRIRNTPRLPHDHEVDLASATMMHWSKAPVYGQLPMRSMRAHSVTMVDSVAWLFGGCDDKGCWKDVYSFDTETMQWMHPDTLGDIPPPCRAHTTTLISQTKLLIFGGGQGPVYYNSTYILDTVSRRWSKPNFGEQKIPAPRRAHTAVLHDGKVWIFGGGNGLMALNDVWSLDVSPIGNGIDREGRERTKDLGLRWEEVETRGRRPSARGYHTANVVAGVMIVVGGSDGKECFSDIWCLNLSTLVWSQIRVDPTHRRLSHSATQVGSFLFIMGGHDGTNYTKDLLLFNLVSLTYERRPTAGRPPSARGYHVAVLADCRMFLFGGFNGHDVFDDVYILDLAGSAYLPQVTSFKMEV